MLEEILQYNKEFVESKAYEKYAASKYPNKKLAILSCMDTRLTELLPAALGQAVMQKMRDNGISEESIEMMKYCRPDFDKWLCGFHKVENSVENSVNLIRKHPLIPDKVQVSGYVIDATTGQLNPVI